MAKIYDLLDGSLEKLMVHGMVPCWSQDIYRTQVPQHPIDSHIYIINTYLDSEPCIPSLSDLTSVSNLDMLELSCSDVES